MKETTKYSERGIEIFVYLLLMCNLITSCYFYSSLADSVDKVRSDFSEQIEAEQSKIVELTVQLAGKDTQLTELQTEVDYLTEQASYLSAQVERLENSYPMQTVYDLARLACQEYDDISPAFVLAVARLESGFNPDARNGETVGLMQINPRWHAARAERLHVTNYQDPYGSLLLGADYLHEIHQELMADTGVDDFRYVLMVYNMGYTTATNVYNSGVITDYATTIMNYYDEYQYILDLLGTL